MSESAHILKCLRGAGPRRLVILLTALLGIASGWAQEPIAPNSVSPDESVPAARRARNVVVITVKGPIDRWTELSVGRRLDQAERAGADAAVIELDTPGGELGAVLGASQAIKSTSVPITVAWVNDDAYSGGAILALACGEVVTVPTASLGDAFPVTPTATGLRGLTPDERVKLLPPLLADVTESARRNGYDEYLVQAIVVDGIELWAVKDSETGGTIFINESEHRALFEGEPVRGKPALASVPGGRQQTPRSDSDKESAESGQTEQDDGGSEQPAAEPIERQEIFESDPERQFLPASPSVADLGSSVSEGLEQATERPVITRALRGRFTDPIYVTDGTAPIVMRTDEMQRFGFSSGVISNDEELKAFFAAESVVRVNMGWETKAARFLSSVPVKLLLIVVFLLGLLIEMTSPGLVIPGTIAFVALLGLVVPPLLVNLAGVWEVLLIGAGILLLAVELFAIPGFGVFGIAGIGSLFVGIMFTFVPNGPSFGGAGSGDGLLTGAATTLLALVTAGIGAFFILRNAESLPLIQRLVLKNPEPSVGSVLEAAAAVERDELEPGDPGEALSPLRPSGRVRINGKTYDAIATRGFIEEGTAIEVVGQRGFSIEVREASRGDRA